MTDDTDQPAGEKRPGFDAADPPIVAGPLTVSAASLMGLERDQLLSMMRSFFGDRPPWEIVTTWHRQIVETTDPAKYLLPDLGQLASAQAAAIAAEGAKALYTNLFGSSAVGVSSYLPVVDVPNLLGIVEHYSDILGSLASPIDITRPVSNANRGLGATILNAEPEGDTDRIALASQTAVGVSETGIKILQPDWEPDIPLEPVGTDRLDALLGAIHPDLPAKRQGAWRRIREGGPDAVSQAAHSLVELLDWTLRLMAPDDEVKRWMDADPMRRRELAENSGRPTRTMRAQLVVRDHPEHRPETALFVKAVAGLNTALQAPKHRLGASHSLDSYAMTVEGVLLFLLTPTAS